LCAYVIDALERRIATPERGRQDHALHGIEWQCRCADCATMIRWAESPTGTLLQMPMNEARRQHVVHNLRLAAAPVETRTVKQGNPHRLELTKRTDLHGQERARRQRWQEALATMHALV
jgi:hypothetical protein